MIKCDLRMFQAILQHIAPRHYRPFAWILAQCAMTCLAPIASSEAACAQSRPVIIILHGRGLQTTDSGALAKQWQDSLLHSLAVAGLDSNTVGRRDIWVPYYASVYNPAYQPSQYCKTGGAVGVTGANAAQARTAFAKGRWPAVEFAVAHYITHHLPSGLLPAAANALFSDTRQYMESTVRRCDTERTLQQALANAKAQGRPIVLLAHSMGTLVAYNVLWNAVNSGQDYGVDRFITFGSQLGVREIIPYLQGADLVPPFGFPGKMHDWANLVSAEDPLAFKALPNFQSVAQSPHIEFDVHTPSADPHAGMHYLALPITGSIAAFAWCRAAAPAPTACDSGVDAKPDRTSP